MAPARPIYSEPYRIYDCYLGGNVSVRHAVGVAAPGRQMTVTAPMTAAQLRRELAAWLDAHAREFALCRASAEGLPIEDTMAQDLVFQQSLWDAGFTRHGWPPSVGGSGGSAVLRAALYEQLVLSRGTGSRWR